MPTSRTVGARPTAAIALAFVVASFATPSAAIGAAPIPPPEPEPQLQSLSGALLGAVRDARGMPLLGAFVAVIALGSERPSAIVVTDARGEFSVPGLPQGVYSLLVGSLGFTGKVLAGINIPSPETLSLQLDEDTDRDLASVNAPLQLGWALRSRARDVLRQTDMVLADGSPAGGPVGVGSRSGWSLAPSDDAALGEFRLWSFTPVADGSETVGVTSLALGGSGAEGWNLRASVGEGGAIWADSSITHDTGLGHRLQLGFGYIGSGLLIPERLPVEDAEEHDSWIGSLSLRDEWQATDTLLVSAAVRYEHNNYLADSTLISPRLEADYRLNDDTHVFTGISYEAEGLDLTEEGGFETASLLSRTNLRVGDMASIKPERTLRYKLGLARQIGAADLRVNAYYDDVTNELVGVYLSGGGVDGDSADYLLFNVGDASIKGFELALAGSLTDLVSGAVSYAYGSRRGGEYPVDVAEERGLFDDESATDVAFRQTHEVQAMFAAVLGRPQTRLEASYNWKQGMPIVDDGELRDEYSRLDVMLRQPLPFRALDSEWSAMLRVHNLMGPAYDGLFNVSLSDLAGLTRGVAGGLAVRF